MTGDGVNDMVGRRADGDLYGYANLGGVWGSPVHIGEDFDLARIMG